MRVLILPVLVASGCIDDGARVATLAEMQPRIEIFVGFAKPSLSVDLQYDAFRFGDCAMLSDDFIGRVSGVELPIDERGEPRGVGTDDSGGLEPNCVVPRLYTEDRPQLGAAVLELSDPSLTIRCDFEDALLARSVAPVPAGPWTFSPGQRVTLRWSPMSDLLHAEGFVTFFGGRSVPAEAVSQSGDLLSFTVPATLGAGPYEMRFATNGADFRGIDCGGVSNRLIENHDHVQAVTISP